MKILSVPSAMVLAAAIFTVSARGDEPKIPDTIQLTPEMRAMLSQLLKATEVDPAEPAAQPTPASPAGPSSPPGSPAGDGPAQKPKSGPMSTALTTGSLRTSSLATSAPLGGARMTNPEWRQLFPLRK